MMRQVMEKEIRVCVYMEGEARVCMCMCKERCVCVCGGGDGSVCLERNWAFGGRNSQMWKNI